MIAGLSYFRLFNGSIKSPQIVEFLKALQAMIGKKLLIIRDRLQAHRSKLVRAHVEAQHGQIMIDYLPAYAPDMNPVECIWGYLKHHAMPNCYASDLGDVAHRARSNLRLMQRRTTLVQAFWKQVDPVLNMSLIYARLNNLGPTTPMLSRPAIYICRPL